MNCKDLFHIIATNAYTYKDLVLKQLVGFNQYSIDVENCKFTFYRWCKEQNKFPTIAMITWYIIGIPTRPNWNFFFFFFFFVVGILITFHKCYFQTNMDKLIFINKNWPSNPQIGWLKPTNFAFACEIKSKLMA